MEEHCTGQNIVTGQMKPKRREKGRKRAGGEVEKIEKKKERTLNFKSIMSQSLL